MHVCLYSVFTSSSGKTCGSRKFCQRESNSDNVFVLFCVLMRGERIQKVLKARHHRPASETPFRWRADDGPTLNWLGSFVIFQGIWTSIATNPIFL